MKTFLRTLFVVIILMVAFVTFLLTPMGLRVTANITTRFISGHLTYHKISGVIIGPMTIEQVCYENKNETIHIGKLTLDWHPLDLLKKRLHISALTVDQFHYISREKTLHSQWNEEKIQHILAEITPFHTVIDNAHLSHIQITDPTSTTEIQQLQFHVDVMKNKWDTQFSALIDKPHRYEITFSILGKPSDYTIHAAIKGADTHWELLGKGDHQSLTLHTPYDLFLGGSLNAAFTLQWHTTFQWQGQVAGKNIHFSMMNAAWLDDVSFAARSTGDNMHQLTTHNDLSIQSPSGNLHLTVQYNHPQFTIVVKGQSNVDKIKKAAIHLAGTLDKHTLQGAFDYQHAKIHFAINGHLDSKYQWNGVLNQLSIAMNRAQSWRLEKPILLSLHDNYFQFNPFCLTSSTAGKLCLQGEWTPAQILGKINITLNHFAWLHLLIPNAQITSGQWQSDLQVQGSLTHPVITGTASLTNGSVYIREINITLHNITADISGKGSTLNVNAEAYSQNQPINVNGVIDLSQPDFLANLKVTSNNTLISNTEEYTIYASAQLDAAIKNNHILVTGNITVPKAMIQVNDKRNTTTLPDDDIVYVGEVLHPPKPFWHVQLDSTVTLGNDVKMNMMDVDATLGGKVLVQQQPLRDMFGTGKLYVRKGVFSVFGQKLTITHDSSLDFANSLVTDPILNFKAAKIIQSLDTSDLSDFSERHLMVGVDVHGPVKALKVTFFSNHGNLSQADILSYILLGYGNTTDTPGNKDFLLRALAAVNISTQGLLGKQNIAAQIQNGLGLSEMGVESETTVDAIGNPLNRQTAFVVGKHLTRKFYARYSFGLLDPVNVFQLRYLFDRHWAVQTDSSILGNGGDVLYTIQRD